MHVCMYVFVKEGLDNPSVSYFTCVCVCMHACMYVCMHVHMYACINVCMFVNGGLNNLSVIHVVYVCLSVCMHVYMYVCMSKED